MRIEVDPSRLKHTKWYEYVLRFVFGGTIAVIAGLIGKHFGPAYGGLFLGFPAILPASITLIEKHESKGSHRRDEARNQAGEDSLGAALGSCGMIAFALAVWLFDLGTAWLILLAAFILYLAVALAVWFGFETVTGRAKCEHGPQAKPSPTAQPSNTA